ncbi:hypothetical protein BJ875DRAFT_37148 [Amylocarpus encephaloides]|uniref:2EXR domain-containing protein n=1 Tax=Amylocarpus encephaloides TaxID=45428 RepID=A0A9P7YIF9_9HELO|nr:hypothetical protein BJ875DRAFT_37148 [Amylocarpus encephaloides]
MAGLLDLPPEIRKMIWSLVIVSPTKQLKTISRRHAYRLQYARSRSKGPSFYLFIDTNKTGNKTDEDFLSISLLNVCRTTNNEAHPLFWDMTFTFESPRIFMESQKRMGPMAAQCLSRVEIAVPHRGSVDNLETVLELFNKRQQAGNPLVFLGLFVHVMAITQALSPTYTNAKGVHTDLFAAHQLSSCGLSSAERGVGVDRGLHWVFEYGFVGEGQECKALDQKKILYIPGPRPKWDAKWVVEITY